MKCPVCKGKGEVTAPKSDKRELRKGMAKVLRKSGYSLREIMSMTGYKSPQGVRVALGEYKKK